MFHAFEIGNLSCYPQAFCHQNIGKVLFVIPTHEVITNVTVLCRTLPKGLLDCEHRGYLKFSVLDYKQVVLVSCHRQSKRVALCYGTSLALSMPLYTFCLGSETEFERCLAIRRVGLRGRVRKENSISMQ